MVVQVSGLNAIPHGKQLQIDANGRIIVLEDGTVQEHEFRQAAE